MVIWTTTPWTIPANLAISVHPEFVYALVTRDEEHLVVAKEMIPMLKQLWGSDLEIKKTFTGKELEGVVCKHPLFDRDSIVICGEHVTLEQGTGCVHTAPGHGVDDFIIEAICNGLWPRGFWLSMLSRVCGFASDELRFACP